MFNLTDPNISYILLSPENKYASQLDNKLSCERACSILYSKDYTVLSVTGYYEGSYEKSFLSIPSEESNDDLRKDLIYLLECFNQECGIIKYKNEKDSIITLDGRNHTGVDVSHSCCGSIFYRISKIALF
jgi:hypothetical protein